MLKLSLNKLEQIAEMRHIKGYKNMSKERLLSVLSESELVESKMNFHDKRLKKIRKDFNELRDRFLKAEIKDIRKNLDEIENPKNIWTKKINEIKENVLGLEERLCKLKKYHHHDDIEHRIIRDTGNLFNQSTDKDYYNPIRIVDTFRNKNNYFEYESKGDRDKNLQVAKYLNMIRPYLNNVINDHKTHGKLNVHSGN